MNTDSLTQWLSANPRMVGVLFTMLVLLNKAGSAAAFGACTTGP